MGHALGIGGWGGVGRAGTKKERKRKKRGAGRLGFGLKGFEILKVLFLF
jgi:hypothetical protein